MQFPSARTSAPLRLTLAACSALALSGCLDTLDLDLRGNFGNAPSTAAAAKAATAQRPRPDNRGIISYPGYQVAVAKRGDTLASLAARIGSDPAKLARYNGLQTTDTLRPGELVALPNRVAEPSPATGAAQSGPIQPPTDIAGLATSAIDRAQPAQVQTSTLAAAPKPQTGVEPTRHRVKRGETAYTVARLYNVTVRSLAEWNGLGPDFAIREGQFLLIPPAQPNAKQPQPLAADTQPGQGSPTPTPPSATKPLPAEKTTPTKAAETAGAAAKAGTAAQAPKPAVQAPDLGKSQSKASEGRFAYPVQGQIIREYKKGKNDGIDIQASAGSPVKAAEKGTIANVSKTTDQVTIVVIKHPGDLLTVYANLAGVTVKEGQTVARGQSIGATPGGASNYVHFEVRKGFESQDPLKYLN